MSHTDFILKNISYKASSASETFRLFQAIRNLYAKGKKDFENVLKSCTLRLTISAIMLTETGIRLEPVIVGASIFDNRLRLYKNSAITIYQSTLLHKVMKKHLGNVTVSGKIWCNTPKKIVQNKSVAEQDEFVKWTKDSILCRAHVWFCSILLML